MCIKKTRTSPDWNSLEPGTLCNLGFNWRFDDEEDGEHPEVGGSSRVFETIFSMHFGKASERTHPILQKALYANPLGQVLAETPEDSFIRAAMKLRAEWFGSLRQILGNRGLRTACRQEPSVVMRQLRLFGVLVIKGKCISPRKWPRLKIYDPIKKDLGGQRLGRLVALDRLPG